MFPLSLHHDHDHDHHAVDENEDEAEWESESETTQSFYVLSPKFDQLSKLVKVKKLLLSSLLTRFGWAE